MKRERERDRVCVCERERVSRHLHSVHHTCRTVFEVFVEQFSFPAKNYFLPFEEEEEEASTPRQIVSRDILIQTFVLTFFRIRLSCNFAVDIELPATR